MDDAQFEQELDQYVEQLIKDNNVSEKNGNDVELREKVKELLTREIDIELMSRISEENSKKIDQMLDEGKLERDELKNIIQSEGIDYNDVVKTATERFREAFSKMVNEKGAQNE